MKERPNFELRTKRNWTAREEIFGVADLARGASMEDAPKKLADGLGDGKETNGRTNRPEIQTNPTLFAAPHAFATRWTGGSHVKHWIGMGLAGRSVRQPD